jgi:DNA-directed RNA polymerase subunit M/transcription elongation factor TFIIS
MRYANLITMCLALYLCIGVISGCSQEVQTGRVVSCKKCGKEISKSVSVITVPRSQAKNYRVVYEKDYCATCGNEMVPHQVKLECAKCGKVYSVKTELAARRLEKGDTMSTEGFCSDKCQKRAALDEKIHDSAERVGDVGGNIGKSLLEGIKKHTH